jgi:hypothetical protein
VCSVSTKSYFPVVVTALVPVSSSARCALVRTERHSSRVHTRMRGAAGTNRSQNRFNVRPQAGWAADPSAASPVPSRDHENRAE